MKKLMSGILLGTLLLSTTAMSFAAENEPIVKQGIIASKVVAATELKVAELIKADIKDLGDDTIEFVEINENGTIEKLGKDCVAFKIDEAHLMELPSFKEFMKDMKDELKDINKTDLKSLETLYNEATTLEKDKKFDMSAKKWDAFYTTLEKYFKDENLKVISGTTALTVDMIDLEEATLLK